MIESLSGITVLAGWTCGCGRWISRAPTPEQGAEMTRIQKALESASKIDLVLLLIAVTAMATARYW